jgi:AbrB family looped-hinge helix DNA binding protein
MALAQSKVTAQGQISIPAEVRKRLAVVPGSVLEWDARGEEIVVRRAARFTSENIHRTIFAKPPAPRKTSELKAGIAQHLRDKHARG